MKTSSKIYDALMENYLLLVESDRQFFTRFHLSQVRYFALFHISQNPEISLTDLSKKLLCTKGNTTRIIQGLVTENLLTVTKDQDDQRAMNLNLTEKGKDLFQLVKREFDEFNQFRFGGIGANPEKLIELNFVLKAKLEDNIKKY
ncbi:MAG: MarR family transcriptional regulator [Anaerolineaceae bacterium]|jgi:DNA-binding MarR family transcriptional regulator|nr:MarR family transcriptional regulator [Anaerolineaceae bacterium]